MRRQMLIMGVKTNVKFENNGLSLDVSPKRKAITDFVPYEDIDDVIAQRHLYGFGIFVIIWAIAFAALSSGLTLLLGLFFLWFYWGGKAIIKRKSSDNKDGIIYMRSFNQAKKFADYFKEETEN